MLSISHTVLDRFIRRCFAIGVDEIDIRQLITKTHVCPENAFIVKFQFLFGFGFVFQDDFNGRSVCTDWVLSVSPQHCIKMRRK